MNKNTKTNNTKIKNNIYEYVLPFFIGLTFGIATFLIKRSVPLTWIFFSVGFISPIALKYIRNILKESERIKKMEEVFPDFLFLMSSNLRAGITIDKSILLSAREEFDPLDKEIIKTGREIATGKDIETALLNMSKRINSDKIRKTILLILSGIKSGGDIAVILEETATSMRQRKFIEKKASSSVLMYFIFIFIAVSFASPALFGLSNVLVEVMISLLSNIPEIPKSQMMSFSLSKINISSTFIFYYSLIFMTVSAILSSLVLGLVSKGEEKEGLKYLPAILIISILTFLITKGVISIFLKGFIK